MEISQIYPQEGWVEQDPMDILNGVKECLERTIDNLKKLDIDPKDIVAIGITNQRETTILWDKVTGKPLYNAICMLYIFCRFTIFNKVVYYSFTTFLLLIFHNFV